MTVSKRCAYCEKHLPEPGNTHYYTAIGRLGDERPVCIGCLKRLKLKPTGLVRADNGATISGT